ncbi:uncharacterized protein LOC105253672 [Camponotus floridanus]|uniref:uncharacterized protein LOC105253672 n=1 Tax=Camponotus floridanus TaxID=104421 RepID=UPI000DC6B475|nr:uncharacterized protein LOC105253672 [Camponotus floridanus]
MGDLPSRRVTPARPFLHTGVDYAGPLMLRTSKRRGHRAYKGYLAIFVFMSTRAVHLEAVSDNSADAFLDALQWFTARRGLCQSITSEHYLCRSGQRQLREFFTTKNPELRQIADQLANDWIVWRFNPPSAPHFGGLWEAAVKSVKHHLHRVPGETSLTYEELQTYCVLPAR